MTERWYALKGPDDNMIISRSVLGDWGSDDNFVGLVTRRDFPLVRAAPVLRDELKLALQWLENLVQSVGEDRVLDSLPNGWGGRAAIRTALELAENELRFLRD